MENQEETRTCGQCHKDVAEANFALHETHCRRFLCLCPDCEEPVPREQLDQHRDEQHTHVRCSKCNQKMERRHLIDHEADECDQRLHSCQYCELALPWKELDEHCLVCGSRTELCRDCGHYVTLKDRPQHHLTCSATDDGSDPPRTNSKPPTNNTKTTVSCIRCMTSFPAEEIEEHELRCVPATRSEEESDDEGDFSESGATTWLNSTYKAMSLSSRPSRGPLGDGGDPNQISTCPHCHLTLPVSTLRWHEVKCQILIHLKKRETSSEICDH